MLVKHTVVGLGMPHKKNLHSSLFPCRAKSTCPSAVGLVAVSQEEGGKNTLHDPLACFHHDGFLCDISHLGKDVAFIGWIAVVVTVDNPNLVNQNQPLLARVGRTVVKI